jgi:hypothetical protein
LHLWLVKNNYYLYWQEAPRSSWHSFFVNHSFGLTLDCIRCFQLLVNIMRVYERIELGSFVLYRLCMWQIAIGSGEKIIIDAPSNGSDNGRTYSSRGFVHQSIYMFRGWCFKMFFISILCSLISHVNKSKWIPNKLERSIG